MVLLREEGFARSHSLYGLSVPLAWCLYALCYERPKERRPDESSPEDTLPPDDSSCEETPVFTVRRTRHGMFRKDYDMIEQLLRSGMSGTDVVKHHYPRYTEPTQLCHQLHMWRRIPVKPRKTAAVAPWTKEKEQICGRSTCSVVLPPLRITHLLVPI